MVTVVLITVTEKSRRNNRVNREAISGDAMAIHGRSFSSGLKDCRLRLYRKPLPSCLPERRIYRISKRGRIPHVSGDESAPRQGESKRGGTAGYLKYFVPVTDSRSDI